MALQVKEEWNDVRWSWRLGRESAPTPTVQRVYIRSPRVSVWTERVLDHRLLALGRFTSNCRPIRMPASLCSEPVKSLRVRKWHQRTVRKVLHSQKRARFFKSFIIMGVSEHNQLNIANKMHTLYSARLRCADISIYCTLPDITGFVIMVVR